jgi:hypothetical protein
VAALFNGCFCPAFNTEITVPPTPPVVGPVEILTLKKAIDRAYEEVGQIRVPYPTVNVAALHDFKEQKSENNLGSTIEAERRRTCYRR